MSEVPMNEKATRPMPPAKTQFQKGRSGNPGGRPGAKKMTRERFRLALEAAVAQSPEELAAYEPPTVLARLAKELALGAARADLPSLRLMLNLLREPDARRAPRVPPGLNRSAAREQTKGREASPKGNRSGNLGASGAFSGSLAKSD